MNTKRTHRQPPPAPRLTAAGLLNALGSLWLAVVLLMLLLVALACATVYESLHGTERALIDFYHHRWFAILLTIFSMNIVAAILIRFPFNRHRIGFILTHGGLLVLLVGALVTMRYGLDGQIGLAEKQSASEFWSRDTESVTLLNRADQTRAVVDLHRGFLGPADAPDIAATDPLNLGTVTATLKNYIPDSEFVEQVVNDNPYPRPAVEVSLAAEGHQETKWVFANRRERVGPLLIAYQTATTPDELRRLISPPSADPDDKGTVTVRINDTDHTFALPDCLEKTVPLDGTPYTLRALRYMPHATVGAENKISNASNNPVNPAVEVEITGPEGTDVRWIFAKFPDFKSMHGDARIDDINVTFAPPAESGPSAPIEVITGPAGETFVGFSNRGKRQPPREVKPGAPIDTPWPNQRFTVIRSFDRARITHDVTPVDPPRKQRTPAVEVEIKTDADVNTLWVQKNRVAKLTSDGEPFEIAFSDKTIPLGFEVALNRFRLGYYPGGMRPRSFESSITITDPASGAEFDRLISMNHPTQYGGFNFYQSSYNMDGGRTISYLSVARDPGQPIVFGGYIMTIVGMIIVLITRMRQRAQTPARADAVALPVVDHASARRSDRAGAVPHPQIENNADLATASAGAGSRGRFDQATPHNKDGA